MTNRAQNLQIQYRPVADLAPAPRNARTHSEKQVQQIAASIKKFGFTNPILLDGQNGIIAGHGRLLGAIAAGLDSVPCVDLSYLTPAERRAYLLADNQIAIAAGWDEEILIDELKCLDAEGFDLDVLGFSSSELEKMLVPEIHGDAEPQVDQAEELNKKWNVKTGDLWLIGAHRLLCGDSTKAEDVSHLLGDRKPVLMVTDPPYGVSYDANWRNEADRANGKPYGASAIGKVANDDRADWSEAYALFPGDVAYVWHADVASPVVAESLAACSFERRALIVWAKSSLVIGRGDYHHQHEPCWYCVRKGKPGLRTDDRKQTTLWEIDKSQKSETGHSTQKPLECMARPMRNHDAPEVYDPFLGSGTTLLAAQNLQRKCYGMEISPAYCAVILERMKTAFPDIKISK